MFFFAWQAKSKIEKTNILSMFQFECYKPVGNLMLCIDLDAVLYSFLFSAQGIPHRAALQMLTDKRQAN